jgi:hypothetical protein
MTTTEVAIAAVASAEAAEAENEQERDYVGEALLDTKQKLLHLLDIYPYLPKALIQTGMSPALPPKFWKPILDKCVEDGEILVAKISTQTPNGRNLQKEVYHLPKYPYPPIQNNTTQTQEYNTNTNTTNQNQTQPQAEPVVA